MTPEFTLIPPAGPRVDLPQARGVKGQCREPEGAGRGTRCGGMLTGAFMRKGHKNPVNTSIEKNLREIQHLTAADYRDGPFEKLIIQPGSLESHGPHLPFGTDALTAYLLALEVTRLVPKTAVHPPVPYGMIEAYQDVSFTVSLRPETETAIIADLLGSVYREGIRRVCIINGHDGNIPSIEIAARTVKSRTLR